MSKKMTPLQQVVYEAEKLKSESTDPLEIAYMKSIITIVTKLLPAERSWAEGVWKDAGICAICGKDQQKSFDDFYSQYEAEKEGDITNNKTDNK